MIMVHPWKSHRVLLQLGSLFFLVYPQIPLQNGGGLRVLHTTHVGCHSLLPSKSRLKDHPGEGAAFSAHEKKLCEFGSECPKNGMDLSHNSMFNGRNSC